MTLEAARVWFSTGDHVLAVAQVFAAFVTALATLALWRVTRVLAVETAALAKMTSQPFVVCSLESSGASAVALNLTLRNTGNATAFDIKLELSPALPKPDGTKADDETHTTHDISLLPPDQVLQIQGVMGTEVYGKVFDVTVSWASLPGESNRESLAYKFKPKDGFRGGWNTKGMHHVAEELEKLRKQMPKQ